MTRTLNPIDSCEYRCLELVVSRNDDVPPQPFETEVRIRGATLFRARQCGVGKPLKGQPEKCGIDGRTLRHGVNLTLV